MTDFVSATDAILSTLKVYWDANAAAFNGGIEPILVYEANEPDLKTHPRETGTAWARAVIRHNGSYKVSLVGVTGAARYRRTGLVWVQIFVPATSGMAYTTVQRLAIVCQKAYEGKRSGPTLPGDVLFTNATILDRPLDGSWVRADCKISFYWDETK